MAGGWPALPPAPAGASRSGDDDGGGGVRTVLNFHGGEGDLVWTERDAAGTDGPLHGADWAPTEVTVRDGRRRDAPPPTLHANGFALVEDAAPATPAEFQDAAAVTEKVYPAAEALVRSVTGAPHVVAFDFNARSAARAGAEVANGAGAAVQGPATFVHGDYTAASAERRARAVAKGTAAEALAAGGRWMLVNVWRNAVATAVEREPLCCCDAQTLNATELLTFEIRYPDRVGENYLARYDTAQGWVYFPRMEPGEALLIKQWDSAGALASGVGDGSTVALHCAMSDPTSAPDAAPRESVEVRLLAVFDP